MKPWTVGIDLAPASRALRAPGTARFVLEQARALFAREVPWNWVATFESKDNPLWEECSSLKRLLVPGQKVAWRSTALLGRAWKQAGCDLGFATAYFVPWSGVPVVANFFDSTLFDYPQTWIDSGRRMNYYLTRTLSTYALWRARKLFVLSEYCADSLSKRYSFLSGKTVVAAPGPGNRIERTSEIVPQTPWGSRPYFLNVSILADNKNQRRLLEAWKILQHRFADFPALVLVGPNEGLYTQKVIRPLIDSLSRPGEVLLTGRISDTELEGWYRHALAYVQPSIAEGFGLPLVEAMARGIPVASSNTTSLPETAGDAAVYFDPMDPEQMASILEKLWQSGPLRRDLVTLGCERVKLFSWEHHARIVAETIEAELRRI